MKFINARYEQLFDAQGLLNVLATMDPYRVSDVMMKLNNYLIENK